jgi:hypothetical protein
MAQKPIQLVNGKLTQVEATVVSTGAGDAGEVVALDSSGKLDVSVLPTGVGPNVKVILASEAIGAGKYVNIYDNTGTPNVRLADNSNGREAHGFVKDAVASAANATVYFEGTNDDLSALTPGTRQYLGTAGGVTATPPTFAGGAAIHQLVGSAISATEIDTDIDDCVVLA